MAGEPATFNAWVANVQREGVTITLAGPQGSGKTLLMKAIISLGLLCDADMTQTAEHTLVFRADPCVMATELKSRSQS